MIPKINMRKIVIRDILYFLIIFIIFLTVLLILGQRWLNYDFPTGADHLSALGQWWQFRHDLLNYGHLGGWNLYWFMGYQSSIALGQIIGLFITTPIYLKLFFFINQALGGTFMSIFVMKLTKDRFSSFISGIFYLLFPFAIIAFVDGGYVTISIAYTITPIVFIVMERYFRNATVENAIIAGIAFAALLLTHRQVSLLLGSLVIFYMFFLFQTKVISTSTATILLSPFLIAIFLSIYWWFPFLTERNDIIGAVFSLENTEKYSSGSSSVNILTFWARYNITNYFSTKLGYFPLILAFLAPIFEPKNRNVLFFSFTSVFFIILSMGINSPIPLYEFMFEHIPLFNGIRTPERFLFAAGFSLSVLSGFTTRYLINSLRHQNKIIVITLITILLFFNVFGESLRIFDTWKLTSSENDAMAWLKNQTNARMVSIPMVIWPRSNDRGTLQSPYFGSHVNPWSTTYLHEKESIGGGFAYSQSKTTEKLLTIIEHQLHQGMVVNNSLLDILGIRYIVLDGDYAISENVTYPNIQEKLFSDVYKDLSQNKKFEQGFNDDDVSIFINNDAFPRIFIQKNVDRTIDLFEPKEGWYLVGKNANNILNWNEYKASNGKSLYFDLQNRSQGSIESESSFSIAKNFKEGELGDKDAINLDIYVINKSNMKIIFNLFENDGERYRLPLEVELKEGWNNIEIPFLLFYPYNPKPYYDRILNYDQIIKISIDIEGYKDFTYFDNFTFIKYEYNFKNISSELIYPGKYNVNVKIDEPSYLLLAETYNSRWKAKDIYGEIITMSEPLYISLNGFWLKNGEYNITLEIEQEWSQTIPNIISILTFAICLGYLKMKKW